MRVADLSFDGIWAVDFEFGQPPGERPDPICMVAQELRTGQAVRLWQDDLRRQSTPPYPTDSRSLFVAYYASAEIGCHLALGWTPPERILDLYIEFRNLTNGMALPCGSNLLGAMACFGLNSLATAQKEEMRQLALRGGPWAAEERRALLDYCESDVDALARLLPKMLPHLDLPRALLRGRYMTAAARIEHAGVPIDTNALAVLREHWASIQEKLIRRVDADYGVYEGRTFKAERWERWLVEHGIAWPRHPSGKLDLRADTFKDMARAYPAVQPVHQLRATLAQMRLADLQVGSDGRNRCLLSAFRARTGRNQPSNAKSIFGPAVWLRGLIRPEPDSAIAYIDWEQQEFGIAVALSGDAKMMAAYESGDPYLAFAKQAGAAPADAAKDTHGPIREAFKHCALGVQYGMGAESLAVRIGKSSAHAEELLQLHRETYRTFWKWSERVVNYALTRGLLYTVFGWTLHVGPSPRLAALRNFPMQANGAEMLRLACCLATERGIGVCLPVHDAILIEAPLDEIDDVVKAAQAAMAEASEMVLGGFRLRTEARVSRYPDRFVDERGTKMWTTVWDLLRGPPA